MSRPAITDEFPTRWRAACGYGLLGAVLLLTVALPIATYWQGTPLGVQTIGPLQLFQGQVVLVAFLALWYLLRSPVPARVFLALPRGRWAARATEGVRVGVAGWLFTIAAMLALGVLAQAANVAPRPEFAELMLWMARRPIALRLAIIAVAMVVEEAFFRAFLQTRLGLSIATLAFALSHMNYGSPMMGAGVFVIGWILGRTFRRTGDLAVCAVAHGTFDAIQLLVVLPLLARRLAGY